METSLQLWEEETQLAEIKKIYAPALSQTEFQAFVGIGKSTGLNPFLREIWAVKYGTSPASIFIGRDGYRKSAQAHHAYDYHQVDAVYTNDVFTINAGEVNHQYTLGDRGKIAGAYAVCKRKGSTRANYVFIKWEEYNTGKSLWVSKPETMIKKVAEAQVLRMTFQELFAGTYEEAETWREEEPTRGPVEGLTQEAPKAKENQAKKKEIEVTTVDGEVVMQEKIKNKTRVDIISAFNKLGKLAGWDKAIQSDKMTEYLKRECKGSQGKPVANLLFIGEDDAQTMLAYINEKAEALEKKQITVETYIEDVTTEVVEPQEEQKEAVTTTEAEAVFEEAIVETTVDSTDDAKKWDKYSSLSVVMKTELETKKRFTAGLIPEAEKDRILAECKEYRIYFIANPTAND